MFIKVQNILNKPLVTYWIFSNVCFFLLFFSFVLKFNSKKSNVPYSKEANKNFDFKRPYKSLNKPVDSMIPPSRDQMMHHYSVGHICTDSISWVVKNAPNFALNLFTKWNDVAERWILWMPPVAVCVRAWNWHFVLAVSRAPEAFYHTGVRGAEDGWEAGRIEPRPPLI